ncbi:MAG: DUF763 domain-containing protein [Thermoplasmata archaeon]|nr:MAG: DUF763 domain-containing protein [Thermoplasmata archaeon]
MVHTGIANLPLHSGKAPKWLYRRMVGLSKSIINVLIYEFGPDEFLERISDPFWFQALSCVLGFDWHSSGTTTVTCAAIAEALNPLEHGIAAAGGKGKNSRKTQDQIEVIGDTLGLSSSRIRDLKYTSRMTAKIDNAAVQDGYNLYHHMLIFSDKGSWCVIQQGMNADNLYARRYHWFSKNLSSFILEPHSAILGSRDNKPVLDMTSRESVETQKMSVDLINDDPRHLQRDLLSLLKPSTQKTLDEFIGQGAEMKIPYLDMPRYINWNKLRKIYEFQPGNYEEFLSLDGVGPATVRALALISDLIYGTKPSWMDPVKYSFAVGGKDGVPFPVDKIAMDETIEILKQGVEEAYIGKREKMMALKRLRKIIPHSYEEKHN